MKRIFLPLFVILLVLSNTLSITTNKKHHSTHKRHRDIADTLHKAVGDDMKNKQRIKLTNGNVIDHEQQFQKNHADDPSYLFKHYFYKTFGTIRKYIDNYLLMATEKKLLTYKNADVNGEYLGRYFDWTKKYAYIKKGIFKHFNNKEINHFLLKINEMLRYWALVKKHNTGGLKKGFEAYYKALEKGSKFLIGLKKAIKMFLQLQMRKAKVFGFNNVNDKDE